MSLDADREISKQRAYEIYKLDHNLTKDERVMLRDYFDGIITKSNLGHFICFSMGAGAVVFKNRKRIQATSELVKQLRIQHSQLSNEELFKKLRETEKIRPNKIGLKAFFGGIVTSMVFGLPINSFAHYSSLNDLKSKVEYFDKAASIAKTNQEYKAKGLPLIEDDGNDNKTRSIKAAEYLRDNGNALTWRTYYMLTLMKPETILKDPTVSGNYPSKPLVGPITTRSGPVSRPEPTKPQIPYDGPVKESSTSCDNPIDYGKFENSSEFSNFQEPEQNSSYGDAERFELKDDDDISNLGLAVGSTTNEVPTSNDQKEYKSAWDRVRSGSVGSVNNNQGGSSWDRIRRNNNNDN